MTDETLSEAPSQGGGGILWLALATVAAAVLFLPGFASLLEAWELPEYSHGFMIPLIAIYIFLLKLREHPAKTDAPRPARWPGVVAVIFALLVGLLGVLASIPDVVTYGFIAWVGGMVLTIFGFRRGMLFWAPVVYLVFMLPLPNFIYWPLSIKLQIISSEIGVGLIALLGVPVYLEGNVIDLGVYKLQVAEACSGLRYLFPLTSFGFLFAVLYRGPVWHKILLFLSAAPITVLMNSVRIGLIGVLVDSFGISQAEGFLHAFEGWIIFATCVGVLFLEAVILQRFVANPRPLSEVLEVNFDGMAAMLGRITLTPGSRALIIASVLCAGTAAAWHLAPDRPETVIAREPLALFPERISGWEGRSDKLDPLIESVLRADDYLASVYTSPDAEEPIDFFIAYYKKQAGGEGIHSPEVCLPTGGWEVSEWSQASIDPPGRDAPLNVNRAVISKGTERRLVYYWFEQHGTQMTSAYRAKALTVWDSIMLGRSDGALMRLVTPIGPDGQDAAAARLQKFLGDVSGELPRFLPG